MSADSLTDFASPLARLFDENLRTDPDDLKLKGWGQFIAAESHADQIGLYGTCAGILVKTVSDPNARIDPGVVAYVHSIWLNRANLQAKYFHQNVRLAFFVMAIARTTETTIASIRSQAAEELIRRQLTDGSWGDWWQPEGQNAPSPRPETTAWAVLALARLNDARYGDELRKAGRYLQKQVLGYANIEKSVDPILLSAIVRALPEPDIDKRTRSAAVAILRKTRPQNEVHIYFFDYLMGPSNKSLVKRDFLCVPAFLSYCLLSSSLDPSGGFSRTQLMVQLAHGRSVEHLKSLLEALPFKNPGSKFPASVDQAFLALSFDVASKRDVRFSGLFRFVRAIREPLRNSWVAQVLLPIVGVTLLATSAKDPNNLWNLYSYVSDFHATELRSWVERYNSVIQTLALGLSFFVGNPILMRIKNFALRKLRL
jgi:hypothetical protein